MSEKNTVSVLICGQEYTLSGDMPREYIMKLANMVDEKMREVSEGRNQTLSKTAVLAAMLIADEYYQESEDSLHLLEQNEELEKKAANYSRLWEDAKSSLTAYKDEQENKLNVYRTEQEGRFNAYKDAQEEKANAYKNEQEAKLLACRKEYEEKLAFCKNEYESKLESCKNEYEEKLASCKNEYGAKLASCQEEQGNTIQLLRAKIAEQEKAIEDAGSVAPEAATRIEELEMRCRDIESSFFDLQMENIKLKNELENYKNRRF